MFSLFIRIICTFVAYSNYKSIQLLIMRISRLICGGLASMLLLLPLSPISAQDVKWCMVTDNGSQVAMDRVSFLLASDASDSFYVVLTDGSVTEGVTKVEFKQLDISAITPIQGSQTEVAISGAHISIMGCQAGTPVQIYSLDGRQITTSTVEGNNTTIDVSMLPLGVYILRVGDKSVKFRKG